MTERENWTDEKVYSAIAKMIEETKITHFPTHKELNEFYCGCGLSAQISRRGGTRKWSKIFNLPVNNCDNIVFGNRYELQAIEDIKNETGYDSELTKERYPYDLFTNDLLKIDIKASKPLKGRNIDAWSFNLEKRMPTCDIYIFYCVNATDEIVKRVIVPACAINGIKQVTIGLLSKYDNYIERWDIIRYYSSFLSEMKTKIELMPKRRTRKAVTNE